MSSFAIAALSGNTALFLLSAGLMLLVSDIGLRACRATRDPDTRGTRGARALRTPCQELRTANEV